MESALFQGRAITSLQSTGGLSFVTYRSLSPPVSSFAPVPACIPVISHSSHEPNVFAALAKGVSPFQPTYDHSVATHAIKRLRTVDSAMPCSLLHHLIWCSITQSSIRLSLMSYASFVCTLIAMSCILGPSC